MMFHRGDNIDVWFAVCFIETYECLEGEEARVWYEAVTNDCRGMAKDILESCEISCATLFDAIMHTVDWEWVLDEFKMNVEAEADPEKIKIDSADGCSVGNK